VNLTYAHLTAVCVVLASSWYSTGYGRELLRQLSLLPRKVSKSGCSAH